MTLSNLITPTFSLERERIDLRFRCTTLVSREWLTSGFVRVRVRGDDLVGFGEQSGHDDHIRIFIPSGVPETVEEMRGSPSREFTPLHWGEDWLDLEFAVHGETGVAGKWAAEAPLGSRLGIGGPRGSSRIEGMPEAWLLVGDETAIPQIRRYATLIPDGASAQIVVEVQDARHETPIEAPVPVEYLHRGEAAPTSTLVERFDEMTEADRPYGDTFVFAAAEQTIVHAARALAVDRWSLDPDRIVIKGYWRSGDSDSTDRASR